MKNRFLFFLSMLVVSGWVITTSLDLYHRYWPVRIIEHHFTSARILNKDKKVKRGGVLHVEYKYSKYRNIVGEISRMLVNDRMVHLTCSDKASLPLGINQEKQLDINVPPNIFPGWYKLVTEITYTINNDRKEHVSWETEWFEVLE